MKSNTRLSLLSLFLITLLAGCNLKSFDQDLGYSELLDSSISVRGVVSKSTNSLMALEVTLLGIKSQANSSSQFEAQTLIDNTLSAFPISADELENAIERFLSLGREKLSESEYKQLVSLRYLLKNQSEAQNATRSAVINPDAESLLAMLLRLLKEFDPTVLDDLLDKIRNILKILEDLNNILRDPRPPKGPPPIDGNGRRVFGPTSCPAITRRYPGGWVPEPAPCEDFGQLKRCMMNDKKKECKARCNPDSLPVGMKCAPNRDEVEEVDCATPPPEWAAICGTLGGNTTATCMTRDGRLRDTFPVGFWVCKNPAFIAAPLVEAPKADAADK